MAFSKPALDIALITLGVTFSTCVLVLNVLTIVAIVKTRSVRVTHSNMFILNLAILDILMIVPQLFFAVTLLRGVVTLMEFLLTGILFSTLAVAAMFNNFAIAVDRFLFIQRALTYPTIVTSSRVKLVVLFIWMVAVVVGTIPLYDIPLLSIARDGIYMDQSNGCNWNSTLQLYYDPKDAVKTGNTNTSLNRISLQDETDPALLIHRLLSCPHLTTPAHQAQTILLFLTFVSMGLISVGLYCKMFLVIREHNQTLATHANVQAGGSSSCEEHSCPFHRLAEEWSSRRQGKATSKHQSSETASSNNRVQFDIPSDLKLIRSEANADDRDMEARGTPDTASVNTDLPSSTKTSSSTVLTRQSQTGESDHTSEIELRTKKNRQAIDRKSVNSSTFSDSRHRLKKCLSRRIRDMRTIKMLMTMFVIFYICWTPIQICKFTLHGLRYPVNDQVMLASWILGTSNSVWNFLVYPMRNRELRGAITRLVCFPFNKVRRRKT
ncbi:alpha-1b adrenergic receptor [Plakobranchus ocellatus]|uniref:Alpha-1b adrenergic receptor n=1 Tax=Plakobranchus ocellatus TaxID=259542 RepID=A0AAV4DFG8_9GAST|nr:alpha-1b adrenergic receptor [Plakobranchus ocellatus]